MEGKYDSKFDWLKDQVEDRPKVDFEVASITEVSEKETKQKPAITRMGTVMKEMIKRVDTKLNTS